MGTHFDILGESTNIIQYSCYVLWRD